MKRINVYIDEEDDKWLATVANNKDSSKAEVIRRAIELYRKREDQLLGEAHLPLDPLGDGATPSEEENSDAGIRKRLEQLEKFIYGEVVYTTEVYRTTQFVTKKYAPDYMKQET